MKFIKIITVTVSFIIVFKLTLPAQDIHQASQKGDIEQVRVLLKKNPGLINMKNRYGMTPLHTASYYGNLEMIRFFLSRGVDIKSTTTIGKTALFYAYIKRRENVVKFLKSKGLEELFIGFTELSGEYLG